mgnify:CR=1 FL=1
MSGGRPDAPSGGWGMRWSQAAGPDGELRSCHLACGRRQCERAMHITLAGRFDPGNRSWCRQLLVSTALGIGGRSAALCDAEADPR